MRGNCRIRMIEIHETTERTVKTERTNIRESNRVSETAEFTDDRFTEINERAE